MRLYKRTILGFLILAILLLISMSYPYWGPEDYNEEFFIYNEKGELVSRAPSAPSLDHPLGTDRNGQDMIYVNIYGMQFTIIAAIIITSLRVLSGVAAGVILGLWFPKLKVYFNYFFLGFRYVPVLIIALFLMAPVTQIYTGISVWVVVSYQIGVLTLIAFPSLVTSTAEFIEHLEKQSFVITSNLMGGGRLHILIKHIWPFMKPYGLLMVVQQLLSTLVLLMHLGIFYVYLGGQTQSGIFIVGGMLPESLSNEWGGLIGQNFRTLLQYPWIVASTLLCFSLLIILTNFMKKELEIAVALDFRASNYRKIIRKGERISAPKSQIISEEAFNFVNRN
jgi:peptide/nickel transport system permease protein